MLRKILLAFLVGVQLSCTQLDTYKTPPGEREPVESKPSGVFGGQIDGASSPRTLNSGALDLITKAKAKLRVGHYQAAAALAERALRIETRSPVVYHLLATSRYKLGYANEARNLALKGKSYAVSNSPIYLKLHALLDEITNP